ncbi:MAG: membrane fusion protein (multidrug efflux system) [Alteromonadaceae bacterium]|jgi:membrane fusion protein (multidrug efflux system)
MSTKVLARAPLYLGILTLFALVVFINWPDKVEQKTLNKSRITVVVTPVQKQIYQDVIEALGTVRANEEITIYPRYAGIVESLYFEDGQVVKKGKILAKFVNKQEQADVRELSANLIEAKSQFSRLNNLRKSNSTSISLLEEQQAKVSAISAQLAAAKAKLAEMNVVAPFDGVLGRREVSAGAFLSTADMLTTLDDVNVVKVDFTVPERDFTTVVQGQTISAKNIAYKNQLFTGVISHVNSRLDNITRAVQVRSEVKNADMRLRPGMLLNIRLERSSENIIMIPESAIIPIENKQFVYVINNDEAERKRITIGRRMPGFAEVLSGLNLGEQLVIEGTIKLSPGAKIKMNIEDKNKDNDKDI